MSDTEAHELDRTPVTVVVGATSKWRSDGANTLYAHGGRVEDDGLPLESRWGLGGALAQRFAGEGHRVVLTTRQRANAVDLAEVITSLGGECAIVELDVASPESIQDAFSTIRSEVGDPDVLIYNAGYMAGRQLPKEQELLEHFPPQLFDEAMAIACRGPFLVAKEVLPAMRRRRSGSIFFSNNHHSLRGRKRLTGESLYYPRTMMRALAQALTEEYSEFGVHIANVVVDGFIDSPGTRALEQFKDGHEGLINPAAIAAAFAYLHQQDPSGWTHELQLTPSTSAPSF